MADLATVQDVSTLFGSALSTVENAQATFLLRVGSARIRALVPTLDTRLDNGQLDPDIPRGILTQLVVDFLHNPVGFETEGINDASFRHNRAAIENRMTPSDKQLAELQPRKSKPSPMFIRTSPCW